MEQEVGNYSLSSDFAVTRFLTEAVWFPGSRQYRTLGEDQGNSLTRLTLHDRAKHA